MPRLRQRRIALDQAMYRNAVADRLAIVIPAWHDKALCRKLKERRFWISGDRTEQAMAAEACFSCPVRKECFTWAYDLEVTEIAKPPGNVYGGSMPGPRWRLLKTYGPGGSERAYQNVRQAIVHGKPVNAAGVRSDPSERIPDCRNGHNEWSIETCVDGRQLRRCIPCKKERRAEWKRKKEMNLVRSQRRKSRAIVRREE